MVAPTYSTDLTNITLAEATTNFTAIGGGGALTQENDFYIQGSFCLSKATNNTWDSSGTARGGAIYNNGAGITVPTDGAVLSWIYWWGPGVLATKAAGGAEIIIGSSTTAYKAWYVTGSDDWAFGGWRNYAINPTITEDRVVGAPTATLQYFGWNANVAAATNIARGNPYGLDAIRYGRCTIEALNGDSTNGYASFGGNGSDLGAAAFDNDGSRRWGLLVPKDGAFFSQGLFRFGNSTTAVDFRDSNRIIFIQNTENVTANFNTFEVLNIASNVVLNSISFQALGTISKGRWITTDNATVSLNSCSFTDMNTFGFASNTTVDACVFRRCGAITQNGAVITNTLVTGSAATSAMIVSNASIISDIEFISGGTGHAIQINTPGTYDFTGHTFTGYASTNGTTGNEVFYNNSGGLVTINASGVTGTISVRNSAGSTTVINNTVSVTISGLKDNTEVRVYSSIDNTPPYSTPTELAGTDNAIVGTTDNRSFSFNATPSSVVYIKVFNTNWIADDVEYTVPATDATIQIPQRRDRVFSNP